MQRIPIHKSLLLLLLYVFCVTGSLFAQCPVSVTVSNPSFIGQGEILLVPSVTADSYQWQFNGVDIPGAIDRIYAAGKTGDYRVRITNNSSCTSVSSQVSVNVTNNRNYVITNEIKKPGVTSNEQVNALDDYDITQNVSYLDGLGRSIQEVATWGSNNNDMVSFTRYDEMNMVPKTYLPVATGGNGEFSTIDLVSANANFYQMVKGETQAYAEKVFDGSPLNRVIAQGAPGAAWQILNGHFLSTNYGRNNSGEIRSWNYNPANGSVSGTSFYNANELYLTQQINESGASIAVYKDKNGLVVCKIVQPIWFTPATWLYTYYIYDDLGNLRYTITPEGFKELAASNYTFGYNDAVCKKWFYAHSYDERSRLTVKRTPGAEEEYIVYDSRDRMVFTQTGNQRNNNQWTATLYDVFDRPVITGLVNSNASLAQLQDAVNTQTADVVNDPQITTIDGVAVYKSPLPAGAPFEQLSAAYYDDYSWVAGTGSGLSATIDATWTSNNQYFILFSQYPVYAQPVKANYHVKGKATGNKTKVLGTNQFLYSAAFYDDAGRTLQVQSINQTGMRDVITYQYDFSGKVLRTLVQYRTTGPNPQNFRVCTKNEYNRLGLLTSVKKKVNSETDRLISTNEYNEIGELKKKSLGNDLEVLNYEHNLRGWLTSINKDYVQSDNATTDHWFGMELAYEKEFSIDNNTVYSNPQYGGNISGTIWKTRGSGVKRKLEYTYDPIDRLLAADFKQKFGTDWSKSDPANPGFTIDFSIGGKGDGNKYIEYDDNGNIKNGWRKGLKLNASPVIDDLTYSNYNGNQLGAVTDAQTAPNPGLGDFQDGTNTGDDYVYDANGNLTKDENKKITGIVYNYLNLPEVITFSNSNGTTNTITYTYDASGAKLQKVLVDNNSPGKTITVTSKYINGCIYESRATTNRTSLDPPDYVNKLLSVPHEEGRLRWTPDPFIAAGYLETDFFITDNLGNVRMILTSNNAPNYYPLASMEDVQDKNDLNDGNNYIPYYGNVDYTTNAGVRTAINGVTGYPATGDVNATSPNDYVAKLNGSGNKIGPSIVLKVMAGDQFDVRVSSWYKSNGATPGAPANPLNDLVSVLANGVGGMAGSKFSAADLQSSNFLGPNIFEFLNGKTVEANRPKAYLNWVFFDEQLRFVQSGSSFEQVPDESEYLNNTAEPIVKWLGSNGVTAERNGYLYVYVSNETPNIDVYFDNLQVTHLPGSLLEENHYYPMGMPMTGICSRALIGLSANKRKFQGQEYEEAFNLNMSEFEIRHYDPQLGRWVVRDPANQFASPYQAMANSWPNGTDPNGAYFGIDDIIVSTVGFTFGYLTSGIESNDWGWRSVKSGLISAAMFEVGYLTGGSAVLAETQAALSVGVSSAYATMGTYIASTIATAAVAQFLPSIPLGDNFSISPALVFGSQGITAGATLNYQSGNFSMGFGFTGGADGPRISYGGGWDDGQTGFSYYRSNYYRSYKQASGQLGLRFGSVSIRFDDDIMGDRKDRYRTGALRVGYRFRGGDELAVGFRIRTGEVIDDNALEDDPRAKKGQQQYASEFNIQREGLLYGGYTNRRGFGINAGINSEAVRYRIQNGIHDFINRNLNLTNDQHFKYIPDTPGGAYFEAGRFYPFALY